MSTTNIEWAQQVWNPTTGCDRISSGCDGCYALSMAKRLKAMGAAKYQTDGDPRTSGPGFGVAVHAGALDIPLRKRKPARFFVNSMSDIGHPRIPRSFVAKIWAVMALTRRHDFLVLSKRPERLAKLLADPDFTQEVAEQASDIIGRTPAMLRGQLDLGGERLAGDSGHGGSWTVTPTATGNLWSPPWPLLNVWLGTSIESNKYCGRADALRASPAALRFLSLEPLLGPLPDLDLTGIDWVIVGGESGPRYRPIDLDWVRDIRDRCIAQNIPLFFKQVGGATPKASGRLLDGRTWDQLPTVTGTGIGSGQLSDQLGGGSARPASDTVGAPTDNATTRTAADRTLAGIRPATPLPAGRRRSSREPRRAVSAHTFRID